MALTDLWSEAKDFESDLTAMAIEGILHGEATGEKERAFLAQILLGSLGKKDLDAALACFEKIRFTLHDPKLAGYLFQGILEAMAKGIPTKAAECFASHLDLWTDLGERDAAAQDLVFYAAASDPARGLELIGGLPGVDIPKAIRTSFAGRPVEIDLIRKFIDRGSDQDAGVWRRAGFEMYGEQLFRKPFDVAAQRITAAQLAPAELQATIDGILTSSGSMDRGPSGEILTTDYPSWLGWLRGVVPAGDYSEVRARLTERWESENPAQAAQWLNDHPDAEAR